MQFSRLIYSIGLIMMVAASSDCRVVYSLDKEVSQKSDEYNLPEGTLSAAIESIGVDQVRLTMTFNGKSPTEYISSWWFSYAGDPTDLSYSLSSTSTVKKPSVSDKIVEEDTKFSRSYKKHEADDGGYFDILFKFDKKKDEKRQFNAGDTFSVEITGVGDPSLFNTGSIGGSAGIFTSVAKVEGIYTGNDKKNRGGLSDTAYMASLLENNGGGGGAPTPEPSTYLMLATMLSFAFFMRRKRRLSQL